MLSAVLAVMLCLLLTSCGEDNSKEDSSSHVVTIYKYEESLPLTYKVKNNSFSYSSHDMKRTGYNFLGLFDSQNGGMQIVDEFGSCNISITSDMTLYARWEADNYNIEFNPMGGNLEASQQTMEVAYGNAIPTLPTVLKEGYDFLGWENANGVMCTDGFGVPISEKDVFGFEYYPIIEGKCTLKAKFDVKKLTLRLDYNNGTYQYEDMIITYGDAVDLKALPKKDDGKKCIAGWSTASYQYIPFTDDVVCDLTLYAIWQNYEYLSFYEHPDSEPIKIRVTDDESTEKIPEPEREGYYFCGWYTTKHLSGLPASNISYGAEKKEYYAKWEAVIYNLSFDSKGGSDVAAMTYTLEDAVELPTAEKENYVFLGWCFDEQLTDAPIKVLPKGHIDDTVLYAKYKGEERSVTLCYFNGTTPENKIKLEYGKKYTLPVPVYEGHAFVGWYDSRDGKGKCYTDCNGVSSDVWEDSENTALYARWILASSKINISKIKLNPQQIYSEKSVEFYLGVDIDALADLGYKSISISISGYCSDYDWRMNEYGRYFVLCNPSGAEVVSWQFKVKGFGGVPAKQLPIESLNDNIKYQLQLVSDRSPNYDERLVVSDVVITIQAVK